MSAEPTRPSRIAALEQVAKAGRALLAEIDDQPAAPEQGGTVGRLRDALADLDENAEHDPPPACFRYPHCESREACGWPGCAE